MFFVCTFVFSFVLASFVVCFFLLYVHSVHLQSVHLQSVRCIFIKLDIFSSGGFFPTFSVALVSLAQFFPLIYIPQA